jgi:hypothetical protein
MKEKRKNSFPGLAAILIIGWAVPGAGHWLMNQRLRGIIFFIAIELTFLVGIAIGGIAVVDPHESIAWFLAQLANGGACLLTTGVRAAVHAHLYQPGLPLVEQSEAYKAVFVGIFARSTEIGRIYTGVAGMLNALVAFDAVFRSLAGKEK